MRKLYAPCNTFAFYINSAQMSCNTVRNCVAVTVRKRTTTFEQEVSTMKMTDAKEVSQLMGVSMATTYKIVRQLNADLKANGCRVV